MATRLLVIRHAQSEANAEGRIQGHLDIHLSDLGRRQSDLLAERLASMEVHALYSSPLRRARSTADALAKRLGLAIEDVPELRERNVGVLEGLNRAEILERFPEYGQPGADVSRIKVDGFEQDAELVARVTTALRHIVATREGATSAIVTHGGVIGTVLRWALDMPRVRAGPLDIDNASLTIIDVRELNEDGRPLAQLVTLNDTCHLDGLADR
jgi:broad specificity phosphatase PhoE